MLISTNSFPLGPIVRKARYSSVLMLFMSDASSSILHEYAVRYAENIKTSVPSMIPHWEKQYGIAKTETPIIPKISQWLVRFI